MGFPKVGATISCLHICMEEGNELSCAKRLKRCESVKAACELQLKEYCMLREHGYHFD